MDAGNSVSGHSLTQLKNRIPAKLSQAITDKVWHIAVSTLPSLGQLHCLDATSI
jgi:hypothetical protein